MGNGGSPDADDRSASQQDSEHESNRSANGHSPRPAGRSRSRYVKILFNKFSINFFFKKF